MPSCENEKGKVDNEFVDGVRVCYCREDKFRKNDLFKKHSFLFSLIVQPKIAMAKKHKLEITTANFYFLFF